MRPAPDEDLPTKSKVASKKLHALIEMITRTTGLGTVKDIYHCFIPALSRRGVLSEANCVVHHVNQLTELKFDSPGQWDNASMIYERLFRDAVSKFGPRTKLGIKATLALVEFLSFLIIRKTQTAPEEEHSITIEMLTTRITSLLRRADEDVILELLAINRQLKLESVRRELSIVEEKTVRTVEYHDPEMTFGRNWMHTVSFR